MARVDLARICAELAELPPETRVAACLGLAAARQASRSAALRVFAPGDCRTADAERCAFFGHPVEHDERICLTAIDAAVACRRS